LKTDNPASKPAPINTIRSNMRAARMSLADTQRRKFDQQIQQHTKNWISTNKPSSLAIFLPFNGEPDLLPILPWLRSCGIQLALPVVNSTQAGMMQFHLWAENTQLQTNRFGIEEPLESPQIARPEVILAPLVAFSSKGTRLGMGAGYYDRCLAKFEARPLIMGVAYELQRLENLPNRDWDIPLDMVFTEKGRFSFAKLGQ